jgi:hypothetical protein
VTLALLLLIVRGSVHPIAHLSYAGIPLLWPVCTEYTLGPLLGSATSPLPTYGRSDANGFVALGPTPTLPTYHRRLLRTAPLL